MITTVSPSVQQATTPQSRIGSIARHAAIGGIAGAAAGAGLSLTALPFVGAMTAPLAAAVGGAAGIVVGGLVGFLRSRAASDGARVGALQLPPLPTTPTGQAPPPPPSVPSR